MSRNFQDQFNIRKDRKEGEVSFKYRKKENKRYDKDDGEYIDYEEVND